MDEKLIENNTFEVNSGWFCNDSFVLELAIKYKVSKSKSQLNMWRAYKRCKPLGSCRPEVTEVIKTQTYF